MRTGKSSAQKAKAEKKSTASGRAREGSDYHKRGELLDEAITQMNEGKYGRSSAALKELLVLDPHNMEARRLFATLHLRLGSLLPARQAFESLADEALERQDFWLAESLLQEYLVAGPRCVPFIEKLGLVYQRKGDEVAAAEEFGKAIDILFEDPVEDQTDTIQRLFTTIREIAPASPAAFRLAAYFDAQSGKLVARPSEEPFGEQDTNPVEATGVADESSALTADPQASTDDAPSWEPPPSETLVASQEATSLPDLPHEQTLEVLEDHPVMDVESSLDPSEAIQTEMVHPVDSGESAEAPVAELIPPAVEPVQDPVVPAVFEEPVVASGPVEAVVDVPPSEDSVASSFAQTEEAVQPVDESPSSSSKNKGLSWESIFSTWKFGPASSKTAQPDAPSVVSGSEPISEPWQPVVPDTAHSPGLEASNHELAEEVVGGASESIQPEALAPLTSDRPESDHLVVAPDTEQPLATLSTEAPPVSAPVPLDSQLESIASESEPSVTPGLDETVVVPVRTEDTVSVIDPVTETVTAAMNPDDAGVSATSAPEARPDVEASMESAGEDAAPMGWVSEPQEPILVEAAIAPAPPVSAQSEPLEEAVESFVEAAGVVEEPIPIVEAPVVAAPMSVSEPVALDIVPDELIGPAIAPPSEPEETAYHFAISSDAVPVDPAPGELSATQENEGTEATRESINDEPFKFVQDSGELPLASVEDEPSPALTGAAAYDQPVTEHEEFQFISQPEARAEAPDEQVPPASCVEDETIARGSTVPAEESRASVSSEVADVVSAPGPAREVVPDQVEPEPINLVVFEPIQADALRESVEYAPPAEMAPSQPEQPMTSILPEGEVPAEELVDPLPTVALPPEPPVLASLDEPVIHPEEAVVETKDEASLMASPVLEDEVVQTAPEAVPDVAPLPVEADLHHPPIEEPVEVEIQEPPAASLAPEPAVTLVPAEPTPISIPVVETASVATSSPEAESDSWARNSETIQFVDAQSVQSPSPSEPSIEQPSPMAAAVDALFTSSGQLRKEPDHEPPPAAPPRRRGVPGFSRLGRGMRGMARTGVSATRAAVLSLVALVVAGGAVVSLVAGGIGLTWVVLEEHPSTVYQSLTTPPSRSSMDVSRNGYVLLLGFEAEAEADPIRVGADRMGETSRVGGMAYCLQAGAKDGGTGAGGASETVMREWYRSSNPAGQFKAGADSMATWSRQQSTALARYQQWQKLSFEDWGFGQAGAPPCAAILSAHRLYLAEGFASGAAAETGVSRLRDDLEAWRTVLGQAKSLPIKMLAVRAIEDDLAVVSGLLTQPSVDGRALSALTSVLRPLDQVELSMRWPMQSELARAGAAADAELAEAGKDEDAWYLRAATVFPLPKQRRLNQYAHEYDAASKAAGEGLYHAPAKSSATLKRAPDSVMDYVTNPLEQLLGVSPLPSWEHYQGAVMDTDARLRLAGLVAALRRGSQEGDVVTRVAKAGQRWYDPYTGLPMLFNAKRGVLYSVGHDGKDQDGDPQEDVTVALPSVLLSSASAKSSTGNK